MISVMIPSVAVEER
jgi:hypothetical protein